MVLLTTLRKTLSLITLEHIRPAVEKFLPKYQNSWAHKMMVARIMKAREEITILGVDMSRAFDTIDRQKLLDGLRSIIDENSLKMIFYSAS